MHRRRRRSCCASKGGLGLLTKVMAMELAEYGFTVNAIAPGEIATPMTGASFVVDGGPMLMGAELSS
jgi:NAD(P)-dependent dehydrogenase (short-subunit alcohol dehydrogenase family)